MQPRAFIEEIEEAQPLIQPKVIKVEESDIESDDTSTGSDDSSSDEVAFLSWGRFRPIYSPMKMKIEINSKKRLPILEHLAFWIQRYIILFRIYQMSFLSW